MEASKLLPDFAMIWAVGSFGRDELEPIYLFMSLMDLFGRSTVREPRHPHRPSKASTSRVYDFIPNLSHSTFALVPIIHHLSQSLFT